GDPRGSCGTRREHGYARARIELEHEGRTPGRRHVEIDGVRLRLRVEGERRDHRLGRDVVGAEGARERERGECGRDERKAPSHGSTLHPGRIARRSRTSWYRRVSRAPKESR